MSTLAGRHRTGGRGSVPGGGGQARIALLSVAAVLALAISAGSGIAIRTIYHVEKQVSKLPVGQGCRGRNCLQAVKPECVASVCDFLLLGSDTRAGLTRQQQQQFGNTQTVTGQRADTIIFVRVDPVHNRTLVLSIPRDLRVQIPGHDVNKINTALGWSANTMVKAVENLVGLPINHYVEVNFNGFQALVNALGGVPICVDRPMIDTLANLNLPRAGCYNMGGPQALAFVRARHLQGDVIPDFSRIARQQAFMRAVIQKVESPGQLLHLPELIKAVQKNLIIDTNLNLYALQDLSRTLSNMGKTASVDFRVAPASPVTINGIDYVQLIQPDASQLFARIRQGKPLGQLGKEEPGTGLSPAAVAVKVYDAGSGGLAQRVESYLQRAGFDVKPVQPAPPGVTGNEILWHSGRVAFAQVLASYFSGLQLVHNDIATRGGDTAIVVGPGFRVPSGSGG